MKILKYWKIRIKPVFAIVPSLPQPTTKIILFHWGFGFSWVPFNIHPQVIYWDHHNETSTIWQKEQETGTNLNKKNNNLSKANLT